MEVILERLKQEYADLSWREGRKFAFRGPRTIYYEAIEYYTGVSEIASRAVDGGASWAVNEYNLRCLHELGHALLGHLGYRLDLERLKMERAAWEKAKRLCLKYGVEYDEEFVEEQLDSYRDWLHQKSRCPECGLTRYQKQDGKYCCPGCEIEKLC